MVSQIPLVGLIVNPVAGMGGSVGLKGTDGALILENALQRGAQPVAPNRCVRALVSLKKHLPCSVIVTCPGEMGENEATLANVHYKLLSMPVRRQTTSFDTKYAAKQLQRRNVRIILFAGGDGTARDVVESIEMGATVLGIPCGVKNFSAVFASSPEAVGYVAAAYLRSEISTIDCEVLDFDEHQAGENKIATKVYGVLKVPSAGRHMQNAKSTSLAGDEVGEQESIAKFIVDEMDPQAQYILGPGSTTSKIAERLGLSKTLLGVDVVSNREWLKKDATASELSEIIQVKRTKLIVSPIGGQGYIFGRGNLQFTPFIIRKIGKENVIIACTRTKLLNLSERRFLVDTGDLALDSELCGFWRAIVGYREYVVVRIEK